MPWSPPLPGGYVDGTLGYRLATPRALGDDVFCWLKGPASQAALQEAPPRGVGPMDPCGESPAPIRPIRWRGRPFPRGLTGRANFPLKFAQSQICDLPDIDPASQIKYGCTTAQPDTESKMELWPDWRMACRCRTRSKTPSRCPLCGRHKHAAYKQQRLSRLQASSDGLGSNARIALLYRRATRRARLRNLEVGGCGVSFEVCALRAEGEANELCVLGPRLCQRPDGEIWGGP